MKTVSDVGAAADGVRVVGVEKSSEQIAAVAHSPSVTYVQIVGNTIENGLTAAGAADDFVFAGVSLAKPFK